MRFYHAFILAPLFFACRTAPNHQNADLMAKKNPVIWKCAVKVLHHYPKDSSQDEEIFTRLHLSIDPDKGNDLNALERIQVFITESNAMATMKDGQINISGTNVKLSDFSHPEAPLVHTEKGGPQKTKPGTMTLTFDTAAGEVTAKNPNDSTKAMRNFKGVPATIKMEIYSKWGDELHADVDGTKDVGDAVCGEI